MIVRTFLSCLLLAALSCSGHGVPDAPADTIRVPRLHGEDVILPVSEAHRITPLNWAMMLDLDEGTPREARTNALYRAACVRNPELAPKVDRLFEIKFMVESSRKRR